MATWISNAANFVEISNMNRSAETNTETALKAPEDMRPGIGARLKNVRNFRDLGGHATQDGRPVRHGLLFRSGSLYGLSAEDWVLLQQHGLRSVCDLRSTPEREREPFAWLGTPGLQYFARDYAGSFGDLRRLMSGVMIDVAQARAAMCAAYRQLPFEQAPGYRHVFASVATGELPMIVHCSAGKDRAGIVAALLLSALGVPRRTVFDDYLQSKSALQPLSMRRSGSTLARQAPEVVEVILGVETDYLEAAFDAIAQRCGSLEGYLYEYLGVDAEALQQIRMRLLV